MSTAIKEINARQILDSRGNPTIEVEVKLFSGINPEIFLSLISMILLTGEGSFHSSIYSDLKCCPRDV